jgi:hypothetical protein
LIRRSKAVRNRGVLPLLAILLVATLLRVGIPSLSEFKFSEARLAALALELSQVGQLPLVGVPSSAGFDHSPFSVYLYVPAFVLGPSPIPATIFGGLVGVTAVLMCWVLGRRWPGGGLWAASVASLLLSTAPWSVAFSRKIWQVVFVPPLTLAFVGLVVSALVGGRAKRLTGVVVVFTILVQVHPSAVSLAPALVLWLIVFWREVRLAPLVLGAALGLLTALPMLLHQLRSGWPAVAALSSLPPADWDATSVRLAWEAITGRGIHALAGDGYPFLKLVPQLSWVFNLAGWLALAAMAWLFVRMVKGWRAEDSQRRRAARIDLILISCLLTPVVFNLRHSLDLHLHFFALILPAAYLLIGRAVQDLLRPAVRSAARAAAGVTLVSLAAAQIVAILLVGRFVTVHATPGGFGAPLASYLEIAGQAVTEARTRKAAEILVVSDGDSTVVDEIPAVFDVLLRDYGSYRFVNGRITAVFPPQSAVGLIAPDSGVATQWYASRPAVEFRDGYQQVWLDGSWPREGLVPIEGTRTFQNGLEFQGYQEEQEFASGQTGRLWLLWQVLWRDPEDTHLFVHLLDENDQLLGQHDSAGYPTGYRRPGDRAITKFDIKVDELAPEGPFWGRAGVYRYPQIVPVAVVDGAGNPVRDSVVVGPLGAGD